MEMKVKAILHKTLERRFHITLIVGGILLASNVILALVSVAAFQHQTIIVTPPLVSKPFQWSKQQVDVNYLEMMTLFWMNLKLNVTPATIAQQQTVLLKYTTPKYYAHFRATLNKEQKAVTEQHISSTFYPDVKAIKVDGHSLQVQVPGVLRRWINDVAMPEISKTYLIQFHYSNGQLLLNGFRSQRGVYAT